MQYAQMQVPLGNMPVTLMCLLDIYNNPTVAFVKTQEFKGCLCLAAEGAPFGAFDNEGFTLGQDDFEYATQYSYKQIPSMLQWLKAQNLQMPI